MCEGRLSTLEMERLGWNLVSRACAARVYERPKATVRWQSQQQLKLDSASNKEPKDDRRESASGHNRERAVRHKVTGSVERDSTTDALAPAHEAGRDRYVERRPVQHRTAQRARRPQPAAQLQHSNGEGEIHVCDFVGQAF